MRVSIFWKLLGGFSVLLVLMLGSESYTLLTLDSAMTQYAHLLKHDQLLIDGARSVQVDFKRQVQEWKNLLLRGRNATDFTKYHQSFLEKYEQVQTQAAEIQHLEMPQEHLKLLQQFIIEHQRLQLSYLEALRLLNVDEAYDARKADRSVRGQDRPPTELLDMLVEYIREDIQAKSDTLYQQTARKQTLLIGIFSLIFALFILTAFVMARNISRPLKELRGVLKEVANGNVQVSCSIYSADEIGDLATSTRDMIAYLQEVAHVTELVAQR